MPRGSPGADPPIPQVLATGLSALYSSLPRKLEALGDDWHCLRREDWMGVSSLVLFMNSLEFCNAVIQVGAGGPPGPPGAGRGGPDPPSRQVAHPLVQKQLVDYVHNGFLVPVMGPALHKVRDWPRRWVPGVWGGAAGVPGGAPVPHASRFPPQTSVEEMIASTAYLELFLRSVSETALLKTFLRFVLLHRHDSSTILDTLVGRINSNSRVSAGGCPTGTARPPQAPHGPPGCGCAVGRPLALRGHGALPGAADRRLPSSAWCR